MPSVVGVVFSTGHTELPSNIPIQPLQGVWTCLNWIYSDGYDGGGVFQM